MGPKTNELIEVLDQLTSLLESVGEKHWRKWVSQASRRLSNSDYSGIEYLLSAYGGMGSFNDLVICQKKSHSTLQSTEWYQEKDNQLNSLRSTAWELTTQIKRSRETKKSEK